MAGDAGDTIIGSVVLGLGILMGLGVNFQLLLWVAELGLVIAGILMVRGNLGANGYVGWSLIILGPALFIVPGFMVGLTVTAPIAAAVLLCLGGIVKFFGAW
jgi:hypothetical protein